MSIVSKIKFARNTLVASVKKGIEEDRQRKYRNTKALLAQLTLVAVCVFKMKRILRSGGFDSSLRGVNRMYRKGDAVNTYETMTEAEHRAYAKLCGARAIVLLGQAVMMTVLSRKS